MCHVHPTLLECEPKCWVVLFRSSNHSFAVNFFCCYFDVKSQANKNNSIHTIIKLKLRLSIAKIVCLWRFTALQMKNHQQMKLKHSARVNEQLVMRLKRLLLFLWMSPKIKKRIMRRIRVDNYEPFSPTHTKTSPCLDNFLPNNISTTTSLRITFCLPFRTLKASTFSLFFLRRHSKRNENFPFWQHKTITRFWFTNLIRLRKFFTKKI